MRLALITLIGLVLGCCGGPKTPIEKLRAHIADLASQPEHDANEVQVQHVLISFQGAGTKAQRSKGDAEKMAAEVYEKAVAGDEFLALVERYTDDSPPGIYTMVLDPAKADQAEKIFQRRDLVPAFGNVGWRLPVGGIGVAGYDQTSSQFGWHIIKRLR